MRTKPAQLRRYLVVGVFFGWALLPCSGYATDGPDTEQNEYGVILDRMDRERQKEYLTSLQRINAGLRSAYAALVKNYTAYRAGYERTKGDLENRRTTPYYVLKKMQDLDAEKERLEAGIKSGETGKKALEEEVLAAFQGRMPQEFLREWISEEERYAGYLNALYRQVGWWMQIEYTPQWRNDESQLWNYIRQYYQDHPEELDILK